MTTPPRNRQGTGKAWSRANRRYHAQMQSILAKGKPLPVEARTKIGRNEPCPCESGIKFKRCHGSPV